MTIVELRGRWEILEFQVPRMVSPELGPAFLGAQGDLRDAQKDMAATLFGALIALAIIIIGCIWFRPRTAYRKERMVEPPSCV
jgi:putative membrane protein